MTTTIVISMMVFVGVSAMIGLLAFVFREGPPKTATRLDMLIGKRRKDDDEKADIFRKTAFESDKKSLLEMVTPKFISLGKIFEQADCNIKPNTLTLVGLLLAAGGVTACWLVKISWFCWPLAAAILFSLPWLWLWNKRRARLAKFGSQLPDALELVARALRAGHSLAAGLHVVGEEMPSPVSDEFSRVFEESNLGISVEEAMRSMCERVPNLDLRFFVTSVAIQRQTGGDLAEILDKIGYVIRERFRILGQVKALTAEGRLSGVILIALPFVLFLIMLHIKYDYVEKLWTHPLGIKMSLASLFMQFVGALVIRKIVNIKV
jgi:tight adherence protein B